MRVTQGRKAVVQRQSSAARLSDPIHSCLGYLSSMKTLSIIRGKTERVQQRHFQVRQKSSRDGVSAALVGALKMCPEGGAQLGNRVPSGPFLGGVVNTTGRNGSGRNRIRPGWFCPGLNVAGVRQVGKSGPGTFRSVVGRGKKSQKTNDRGERARTCRCCYKARTQRPPRFLRRKGEHPALAGGSALSGAGTPNAGGQGGRAGREGRLTGGRVGLSVPAALLPSEDLAAKEQLICSVPSEWRESPAPGSPEHSSFVFSLILSC